MDQERHDDCRAERREAMESMARSSGWRHFLDRLAVMERQKVSHLRSDLLQSDTDRTRGYLDALDDVRRVPQILIDEGKPRQ